MSNPTGDALNHSGGIGDEPIEPRFRHVINALSEVIDDSLNDFPRATPFAPKPERKVGFVLLVFPFHDHNGRCNYISSADRDDVVKLLEEQLKRFKKEAKKNGKRSKS